MSGNLYIIISINHILFYFRFVHFEHQVVPIAAIRRCMKGDQTGRPKQNRRLDQKQFDTGRKIVDQ